MAIPRAALINRIMRSGGLSGAWTTLTIAMLTSALMVGIGMMQHLDNTGEHPAAEMVRSYLDAIRDRDVELALGYTSGLVGDDSLLTPDAIDPDWEIEELAVFGTTSSSATVTVVITSSDGQQTSGTFQLQQVLDEWSISDPFAWVTFESSPLSTRMVNNQRITVQDAEVSRFAIFPGVYRFHDVQSTMLEGSTDRRLLLNTGLRVNAIGGDLFTLTAAGEEELQRQVDVLIDECAERTVLLSAGCPFGAKRVPVPDEPGYVYLDLDDVTWTAKEYPVVTGGLDLDVFKVSDRQPGIVTLSGVANGEQVTVDCPIIDSLLRFEVDGDDLRLLDLRPDGADADAADYPTREWWSTCRS